MHRQIVDGYRDRQMRRTRTEKRGEIIKVRRKGQRRNMKRKKGEKIGKHMKAAKID